MHATKAALAVFKNLCGALARRRRRDSRRARSTRAARVLLGLAVFLHAFQVAAETWYVDNAATGSTNTGVSWADAWTSFAGIDWSSVHPGDTIYISGGATSKTYNETLTIGASGTSDSSRVVVTVDAVDANHGGQAIIDGQGSRPNGIVMRDWVTIDGVDTRYRIKVQNTTQQAIRHNGSNCSGYRVRYVEITGRRSEHASAMIDFSMSQSRNHIVEHNYIHDVNEYPSASGIRITNNTGDCSLSHTNNEIHHNIVSKVSEDGIGVTCAAYVHDNLVGPNDKPAADDWAHHDGIVAQGSNVRIVNNTVHGFGQNLYVNVFGGKTATGVKVFGNVVYQAASDQYRGRGYGISIAAQYVNGPGIIDGLEVVNNTFVDTAFYGVRVQAAAESAVINLVMKNNLFVNAGTEVDQFDGGVFSVAEWNYNYYRGDSFSFRWGSCNPCTSVASWQATTGYDLSGGQVAEPWFVDQGSYEFRLTSLSANLIDRGGAYPFRTADRDGNPQHGAAWDIGAYEYAPGGDTLAPAAPTNLTVQ